MISSLLIFVGIAFALVLMLRIFKIGPMLGFLIAGIIAGPHVLGLFEFGALWEFLGEIALVFLWFVIGLELNMKRLWGMRRTIFGFGAAQVMMVIVMLFPILFGLSEWSILSTVMVSFILAMSSTSADLQMLADRNELQTTLGRQTFSILLFQNLLAIPLLAMMPIFAGNSFKLGAEVIDILVLSVGLILGVVIIGQYIINPLMRRIAKLKSKEVFLMTIILILVLCVLAINFAGLPMVMGAFLAGMILSETVFHHQIQTDVAPYQLMFLAFFFIALGMGLNVPLLVKDWWIVALGVLTVLFIKFVAIYIVARVRHVHVRESFMIALILSGCGEFGLLMLQTMKLSGIDAGVPVEDTEILMAIIIISMLVTPVLVSAYYALYKSGKLFSASRAKKINGDEAQEKASVIICGFGRVGQTVAIMLEEEGISYVAIDMDVDEVARGRDSKFKVLYGDTTNEALLREIGLAPRRTRAVIIALDNAAIAKRTVRAIKRVAPRVRIFARARNMAEADILVKEGVKMALPETVESSFMLGYQVLESLGISEDNIGDLMSKMRLNNYAALSKILKQNKK